MQKPGWASTSWSCKMYFIKDISWQFDPENVFLLSNYEKLGPSIDLEKCISSKTSWKWKYSATCHSNYLPVDFYWNMYLFGLQVWKLVELMFLMRFRRLWEFSSFWEINLVEPFQFSKWPILTEWIPALFLSTLFPGLPVTKYDNTLFSSLSHKMVITVVIYIPPWL